MKDRTNYNNTNNNITTCNNNIIKDRAEPPQRSRNDIAPHASSFDSKSQGGAGTTRQTRPLPRGWQWVKVDLYDTGDGHRSHHKLSVSIFKAGEIKRFKSLNNSPWRLFKRGFGQSHKQDPHYQTVAELREQCRAEGMDPRVSKCYVSGYRGGKSNMTKGLSTMLIPQAGVGEYSVAVILESEVIWCALQGGANTLTTAQRTANIVATGTVHGDSGRYGQRIGDIL
jgi:hypothetical protein